MPKAKKKKKDREKKKLLKQIKPESILNSPLWKPSDTEFNCKANSYSWFDIKAMNTNVSQDLRFAHNSTIRSEPILIKPTPLQREKLFQWNEIYRQVYNLTVSYFKTNPVTSFQTTRPIIDKIISRNKVLVDICKESGIPKHTRDNAIKDCIKAYKTAFSNIRAKNIKHFKLRYKRKSHHLSSIVIEPVAFSKVKNGFAIKTLGEIKSSKPLTGIVKESRLCYNSRTGIFVLRVPYEKITKHFVKNSSTCSIDPGMRTFQTVYSPDSNNCLEICTEDTNKQIKNIINKIHNPNKVNPNYKKYVRRLRERLGNKIKDMHYKTCNFLCRSFNTIVIGNMSTQSIVSKDLHLNKVTKDYCHALSHYTFRERLKNKAEEYGCQVLVVDESYTSKTCGGCGVINAKLGSNKTFDCKSCDYKCDRDVNAARNILIKTTS
jgi:IS605 OrfB family transposase